MPEVTWIPVRLFPSAYLKFKKRSLLPGVSLLPLENEAKEVVTFVNEKNDPVGGLSAAFQPSHVIRVSDDEYTTGLKKRLHAEGRDLPDETFVEHHSIAKQTLLSLLLAGPIHFELSNGCYRTQKSAGRHVVHSWARLAFLDRVASTEHYPICSASTKRITGDALRRWMSKLDRYFRSGMWWTDRLGMTLEYFWNGICTSHSEQAFLSLTTAIESLLTTQSMEITHNLAERAAVLLGSSSESRLARYRQIKKLYSVRSKIVHGKVYPKKGAITWGTLVVGPKFSNVPRDDLQSIIEITLALIRTTFRRPTLPSILHKKQSET